MKPPLEMLDEVAAVLQEANVDGAFAGGAVLPLMVEAAVATELRPTYDVDVIVPAASYAEYQISCGRSGVQGSRPGCKMATRSVVTDVVRPRST